MRWLVVIVPGVVLVGFAFEPDMQVKFTATLIGVLAILYLPLFLVAWATRQITSLRPGVSEKARLPSALEMAHQTFADEEARTRFAQQSKAAMVAREEDDRDSQARDLERHGIFSLWNQR